MIREISDKSMIRRNIPISEGLREEGPGDRLSGVADDANDMHHLASGRRSFLSLSFGIYHLSDIEGVKAL